MAAFFANQFSVNELIVSAIINAMHSFTNKHNAVPFTPLHLYENYSNLQILMNSN